jgi:hypothetical protein
VYRRRSRVYTPRRSVDSRRSLFRVGGAHLRGRGTPLMVPVTIFWRAFIFVSNDFSKKKTGPKIGRSLSL